MAFQLSILHSERYAPGCLRRASRRRRALGSRLAVFGVAAALALLTAYGEQWMLSEAPAASTELVAATSIVDAVYGDRCDACNESRISPTDKADEL